MGQALYRKYRSKKLSEVVGQDHITRTLERALQSGKLSHAYLFTGPRGVGKTSVARILAHEINDLPYTDESMHLDIIEIDAASNRRIDEIRDLRDKVHIAPTSAKYKVYIIDEVHMLTKEAFNALLKTLEEPPAHVVFILATTELHKLPETIISRTQRFTFKPIDEADAVRHLGEIAEQEGMDVDKEALSLLAAHGRGSFRDSISLLDQVGNSQKKITKADAEKLVGIASSDHMDILLQATLQGTPAEVVEALENLTVDGIGAAQTAKQLSKLLRQRIIASGSDISLIQLLADLISVNSSQDPTSQLEVALFKANLAQQPDAKVSKHSLTISETAKKAEKTVKDLSPVNTENAGKQPERIISSELVSGEPAEWWNDVLQHIKTINNTLYGMLRMAEATLEGETLNLKFGFGFHKKKAEDASTKSKIRKSIKAVTGKSYKIAAFHDKSVSTKAPPIENITEISTNTKPVNEDLTSITNVFGGGEVLES